MANGAHTDMPPRASSRSGHACPPHACAHAAPPPHAPTRTHTHHRTCYGARQAEDDSGLLKEEPHVEFTGEEGLGRYLDLHDLFSRFLNAKLAPAPAAAGPGGGKVGAGAGGLRAPQAPCMLLRVAGLEAVREL